MSPIAWNVFLLAWKWILILLVYALLFLILFNVRREMANRRSGHEIATGRSRVGARPAPLGRLQVVQPGSVAHLYPGTLFSLSADTCLGAASDNDIVLPGVFISAHHARLRWDGTAWWVEDLASRNGTSVGGAACLPHTPQTLSPGVPIQLGDATFELVEAK